MTADESTGSPGTSTGLTLTVSSTGPGDAAGVSLDLELTNDATWSIDSGAPGTNPGAFALTPGPTGNGPIVSFAGQPLTLSAGTTLKVHLTAAISTSACNRSVVGDVGVTATNTGSQFGFAQTQVPCLKIAVQSDDEFGVQAGQPAGFTVTISNVEANTIDGMALTTFLGQGVDNDVVWSIDQGAPGTNPSAFAITGSGAAQTLSLANQPISLAAGASLSVHIVGTGTNADDCSNEESLTVAASVAASNANTTFGRGDDLISCNGLAGASSAYVPWTNVLDTIASAKEPITHQDPYPIWAGTPIQFRVTVSNMSGSTSAYDVALSDPLPAATSGHWTIDSSAAGTDPGLFAITGTIGNEALSLANGPITLAPGQTVSVVVTAPTSPYNCDQSFTNSPKVTTANADLYFNSSSSQEVRCVTLGLTMTADAPVAVSGGTQLGFTLTLINNTPLFTCTGNGCNPGDQFYCEQSAATGAVVTDSLPAGITTSGDTNWGIDYQTTECDTFTDLYGSSPWYLTGSTNFQHLYFNPLTNSESNIPGGGDYPNASTSAVHITTVVTGCGSFTNSATLTGDNVALAGASATVDVPC